MTDNQSCYVDVTVFPSRLQTKLLIEPYQTTIPLQQQQQSQPGEVTLHQRYSSRTLRLREFENERKHIELQINKHYSLKWPWVEILPTIGTENDTTTINLTIVEFPNGVEAFSNNNNKNDFDPIGKANYLPPITKLGFSKLIETIELYTGSINKQGTDETKHIRFLITLGLYVKPKVIVINGVLDLTLNVEWLRENYSEYMADKFDVMSIIFKEDKKWLSHQYASLALRSKTEQDETPATNINPSGISAYAGTLVVSKLSEETWRKLIIKSSIIILTANLSGNSLGKKKALNSKPLVDGNKRHKPNNPSALHEQGVILDKLLSNEDDIFQTIENELDMFYRTLLNKASLDLASESFSLKDIKNIIDAEWETILPTIEQDLHHLFYPASPSSQNSVGENHLVKNMILISILFYPVDYWSTWDIYYITCKLLPPHLQAFCTFIDDENFDMFSHQLPFVVPSWKSLIINNFMNTFTIPMIHYSLKKLLKVFKQTENDADLLIKLSTTDDNEELRDASLSNITEEECKAMISRVRWCARFNDIRKEAVKQYRGAFVSSFKYALHNTVTNVKLFSETIGLNMLNTAITQPSDGKSKKERPFSESLKKLASFFPDIVLNDPDQYAAEKREEAIRRQQTGNKIPVTFNNIDNFQSASTTSSGAATPTTKTKYILDIEDLASIKAAKCTQHNIDFFKGSNPSFPFEGRKRLINDIFGLFADLLDVITFEPSTNGRFERRVANIDDRRTIVSLSRLYYQNLNSERYQYILMKQKNGIHDFGPHMANMLDSFAKESSSSRGKLYTNGCACMPKTMVSGTIVDGNLLAMKSGKAGYSSSNKRTKEDLDDPLIKIEYQCPYLPLKINDTTPLVYRQSQLNSAISECKRDMLATDQHYDPLNNSVLTYDSRNRFSLENSNHRNEPLSMKHPAYLFADKVRKILALKAAQEKKK